MNSKSRIQGFTLVELLIVIMLLAALASIAIPLLASYMERARAAACLSNRHNIEQDERSSYLANGAPSLVIDNRYKCPSGGVYAWLVSDPTKAGYPSVGCSLHFAPASSLPPTPTPTPLTSLGSTFTEITTSMIDLTSNFYQQKNRYPRSFGDYVFTDIGLNPAEWAQPINGLYYKPGGSAVRIRPDNGYSMTMKSIQGATMILTAKLSWDLIYDMVTEQWYYHSIKPQNAVDIKTLQVTKN